MLLGVAQTRGLRRGGTERLQSSLRKNGFLLSSVILAYELPNDCVAGGYQPLSELEVSQLLWHMAIAIAGD